MQNLRSKAEKEAHKNKLAASYHELLEEFSSEELRTVGNYSLGRLLGKGSFGKVYLANHNLTNGTKVVLKSANKDDANLAREIHHHRQFLHPHIARLYEVIVTESLVWLVLEYCPGDELYNYLAQHGALPVEKVQRMFAQLVGAVSYIHNLNCVHRDLKLENILLDKHENVKLVDFGFTREYEGKQNHLQTFCGTVCYSAPEMLKGEKYAGEKVDVWSLGVILYALLVGELPFDDDDDLVTKHKILSREVKYPDNFPDEAKALLGKLLSKRPLLRPTLAEILADPFLKEYAPAQQAILKVSRPAPFTTPLEKDVLQRMRSAGVDIDKIIENVLSQRCDALAGWWALLLEKEERKEKRRERKRREKEEKIARRVSAASLLRASMLEGVTEESPGEKRADETLVTPTRGRKERRSLPNTQLVIPEMPRLPEGVAVDSPASSIAPPNLERESVRSVSTSRPRPVVPPKVERRRSRSSTLQLAVNSPSVVQPQGVTKRRNQRRRQLGFLGQLASIKHWFIENTKRTRSPNLKADKSVTAFLTYKDGPAAAGKATNLQQGELPPPPPVSLPVTKPLPTQTGGSTMVSQSTNPRSKRNSLSPAPLTPRSSYRRSSAGLRGRKSTSSSVSSIRSIHHVHTHSKTSSVSSRSESVQSSALGSRQPSAVVAVAKSPHASVKVLPATPTNSTSLPSNLRLVRGSPAPIAIPNSSFGQGGLGLAAPRSPNPWAEQNFRPLSSPGLVFAKRKKTPFRGPMLGNASGHRSREGSRSGSVRRHSRLTIAEEEEEEEEEDIDDDDEDVEEVDEFSPTASAVNSPGLDAEAEDGAGPPAPSSPSPKQQQNRQQKNKQHEADRHKTSDEHSRLGSSGTTGKQSWVEFSPSTDAEGGLLPQVMAAGSKAA